MRYEFLRALLVLAVSAPAAAQSPLPSERFVPNGFATLPTFTGSVTSFDVTAAGQVVTRDDGNIRVLDGNLAIATSIACASTSQAIRELAVDAAGQIVA